MVGLVFDRVIALSYKSVLYTSIKTIEKDAPDSVLVSFSEHSLDKSASRFNAVDFKVHLIRCLRQMCSLKIHTRMVY